MSRRARYTRNLGRRLPAPLPAHDPDEEWIRFEHAHEPYGLFSYGSLARPALEPARRRRLEELYEWFDRELDLPSRMHAFRFVGRRTGSKWRAKDASARCWFRASATEHVERARELAALLREAGIPVIERRARGIPGKLCSEDSHQIAVELYRDSRRERRRVARPSARRETIGAFDEFVVVDADIETRRELWRYVGEPREVALPEPLIDRMSADLAAVPAWNPSRREDVHGLCRYGVTVIRPEGALIAARVFRAWSERLRRGPARVELEVGHDEHGRACSEELDRDRLVLALQRLARACDRVATNPDLRIVHMGP